MAGYLPFHDPNLMVLYKMICRANVCCPPWFSSGAEKLIKCILDPNPQSRITIVEILEDEWLKKDYKPPHFEQGEDVSLDDVDAAFDVSEEHLVAEKKEKPESMNAFALISRSQGFNLGNLFEKEMMGMVKQEASFTSQSTPQEIMSKIEEACGPLGFNVRKQNCKMKLKGDKTGRKGHLSVATEVFEVAPSLHMVELRKTGGGTHWSSTMTGEDVALSRRVAAAFLLMTMADFSDQLFDWQDRLFDNTDGRLEFRGNTWTSLWPGTGKPGLWTTSVSRMGALYTLIVREEEIYIAHRAHTTGQEGGDSAARDEGIDLVIPPVFDGCTKVLSTDDQKAARDLYWEAICSGEDVTTDWSQAEELLQQSVAKNPFVGEPHLVLAQVYLNMERHEEAVDRAEEGLKLLLEWGSSWDKRMPWEGWVSWGRAMLVKAKEKDWPHTSFGILSLGLVK